MPIKLQDIYGLADLDHPIEEFDATKAYAQDDLVIYNNKISRAKGPVTPGAWDAADWAYSVSGKVYDAVPPDSEGMDHDVVLVGVAKAPEETIFELGAHTEVTPGMEWHYANAIGAPYDAMILKVSDYYGGNPAGISLSLSYNESMFAEPAKKIVITTGALSWEAPNLKTGDSYSYMTLPTGMTGGGLTEFQAVIDAIKAGTLADYTAVVHFWEKAHQVYRRESGVWVMENLGVVNPTADSMVKRDSEGGVQVNSLLLNGEKVLEKSTTNGYSTSLGVDTNPACTEHRMDICIGSRAGVGEDMPMNEQNGCIAIGSGAAKATGIPKDHPSNQRTGYNIKRRQFYGCSGGPLKPNKIGAARTLAVGDLVDTFKTLGTELGSMFGVTILGMGFEPSQMVGINYGDIYNVTCVGYNARPTGADNEITLGNDQVTKLRCKVTSISALSDERDKKDIADLNLGLDFINGLRPVSFEWDEREGGYVGIKSVGFIAQEMLEAEKNSGMYEYLGMVSEDNPEKLELRTGELIPILTKAVQELSAQVKALTKEIEVLKKKGN